MARSILFTSGRQRLADNKVLYKTGFDDLDALIGVFAPGQMTIIASRPQIDKSALLSAIALEIADHEIPVLYITTIASESVLMGKMACSIASVDRNKFLQGLLDDDDLIRIRVFKEIMTDNQLEIVSLSNPNSIIVSECIHKFVEK